MYKLVGTLASRAFRVAWALEEIGVPYEVIAGGPHSDAILQVNPSGKIPALLIGDEVLTDSTAIMTYLADKHRRLAFPAGTVGRARQDAMTCGLIDDLDAVLWTASRQARAWPEEARQPGLLAVLHQEFDASVTRLGERFVGPFLMGETMTIADILAVHCLGWAIIAKFPVSSPIMRDYRKALAERPAYQRAREAMS